MVADITPSYPSERRAIEAVARQLGIGSPETVRRWVRAAMTDPELHPNSQQRCAKPADQPLKVRVRINYVGGAEGATLRRAQGQALRALLQALADQQSATPESHDDDRSTAREDPEHEQQ